MKDNEMKWFFIAMGAMFGFMFIGIGVDAYSDNMARKEIAVACYQNGGGDNCEKWIKE